MSTADKQGVPPLTVLHAGCGTKSDNKLPEAKPDIVDDIRDMPMVQDCSVDAVFSSHNLEYLYHHEALLALCDFHRVVRVGTMSWWPARTCNRWRN